MAKPSVPDKWVSEEVDVDQLFVDPENPRLTDFGLSKSATQNEIIKTLWNKMAVDEVALSIAENGFYEHEPLYAARERGKLFVVEGNRWPAPGFEDTKFGVFMEPGGGSWRDGSLHESSSLRRSS